MNMLNTLKSLRDSYVLSSDATADDCIDAANAHSELGCSLARANELSKSEAFLESSGFHQSVAMWLYALARAHNAYSLYRSNECGPLLVMSEDATTHANDIFKSIQHAYRH